MIKSNIFNGFLKRNLYLYLIILLSFLPFIGIFLTSEMPSLQDGLVHLARMGAYFKALSEGQIPVRWVGDLNYGYGMPLFNYIYHFPYLLSSLFLFLGIGLVTSFKITILLSYLLSGIFMFLFARAFFNDNKAAFLITVFYQFFPFRLVELFIRGAYGEIFTFSFLPLILFGLVKIFKETEKESKINLSGNRFFYFLTSAVGTFLLIISHNALSFLFFAICIFFILFFAQKKENLILGFSALILGLLMSAYYWMPAIFEHKYTYGDLFMKKVYLENFPPLINLFIPNFLNNNPNIRMGDVPIQIGLFPVIAFILSILLILRKKIDRNTRKIFILSIIIFFISLFFMNSKSEIFWKNNSFLRQFQFPWRFLGMICFATSISAASFLKTWVCKNKYLYYLLIFIIIISSVSYWRPILGYLKLNENYYWNFPLNTTFYGETDVIWSAGPAKSYPKQRVEIIDGIGIIKNFLKRSNQHTFTVDLKKDSYMIDHTQYFPGWKVFVDGKSVPIQFQNQNYRGEITFLAPEGLHNIIVSFGETKIRFLADMLSLFAFVAIFFLWFAKKKHFMYEIKK